MKTLVLLSGGLDSATVLAGVAADGDERMALGFDYGQPHKIELERAADIANHYETPFKVIAVPAMPRVNDVVFAGRNLVLASIAVATAQARRFERIAVGCNKSDAERFPDCRSDFWWGFRKFCTLPAYNIDVHAPLLDLTKRGVVELARKLNVPIDTTWSCYEPRRVTYPVEMTATCGRCLACTTRQEALQ